MARWLIVAAALLGASGVAIGAVGAHALPVRWEGQGLSAAEMQRESERLDTAVNYQLIHAIALVAIGVLAVHCPSIEIHLAGMGMVAGVVLFSGFLISHAIWRFPIFLNVVPYGGSLLILSWIALAFGAIRFRSK